MAQIGTIKVQTDSGIVDVPVFEISDFPNSGSTIDALRVQTDSGIGAIPLTDPADASNPQEAIRVQTDSGVKAVTDSATQTVSSGLVAWYRFEDSSNTAIDATNALGVGANQTAFDGSVNGASFQSSGGVTDVVSGTGTNSGAYDFDGVDDFIKANGQPLDSTTDMTVSLFVKPDDSDFGRLVHTNDDSNGFRLFYGDEQVKEFSLFEDGEQRSNFTSRPPVPIGKYTQIAVTFNDSSNEAKLLTNGQRRETISTTGSGSDPLNFTIGAASYKNDFFFNGNIDDVRIYNRALSASEINQIYNNTKP